MLDKYIRTKTFSYIYSILLFAIAVCIIFVGWDQYTDWHVIRVKPALYTGIQILVLITSLMLVVSSRLTDAMLPAMLLVVLATACYDSADEFTAPGFIWVAIPAVFAAVFHFIKYRGKFKIGRSFWGLCGVTAAVTLGGLGTISVAEYFNGTSLFYVFGLGIGMIAFYLLVKSQVDTDEPQNIARIMYMVGLLSAFSIYWMYITNWDMAIKYGGMLHPQFGNNLSTLMMMALPFTFYYASKRCVDFISTIIIYGAIAISGSRGGLLMGTVEMAILLVFFSILGQKGKRGIANRIIYIGSLLGAAVALWTLLPTIARLGNFIDNVSGMSRIEIIKTVFNNIMNSEDTGDTRVRLFGRMISDFKSNPLFGTGLGYTGNTDLYAPVKGAMCWYHMWLPQIVGSLGTLGILTYGYQLVDRFVIVFKNSKFLMLTFFMSYVGLLLMSQLNPGEFCPMPYAALAATYFAFMEKDDDAFPLKKLIKKRKKDKPIENTVNG